MPVAGLPPVEMRPERPDEPTGSGEVGIPSESGEGPAPRFVLDSPSYYLRSLRRGGIEIDAMTPMLLTPLEREDRGENCPPRLVIVGGADSYERTVRPFLEAIGPMALDMSGTGRMAREAVLELTAQWKKLLAAARGDALRPLVRVMFKHYPRPELPGRCVTLQATVYTVPDSFFDRDEIDFSKADQQGQLPLDGVIFELRKTYQLDAEEPRLVESMAEVHTSVVAGIPRSSVGFHIPELSDNNAAADGSFSAHFDLYGGGHRIGLAWIDLSAVGRPDESWSGAYAFDVAADGRAPAVKAEELSPALVEALKRFILRA